MSEYHHHDHPHREEEQEPQGQPIVPEIIFTRDAMDPRRFAQPGETGVSTKGPSRTATWFSVAVIVLVLALGVFAIVSSALAR